MPLTRPLAGVERRTAWVRAILLGAMFLGLVASAPVWLNARTFPLMPIAPWFPSLPAPWDKCRLALMLVALVMSAWFYRGAVTAFLAMGVWAYLEDQNRGQPWFYMYWVMLLLTVLPAPSPLAACRCALSAVYFWSGLQKCNPRFFEVVPAWFVAPAAHWHLPAAALDLLRWSVASAPFVEIGIGLAVWTPRFRWAAIAASALVHLTALLFLGPLGYNYNWVVWPWNLAMVGLICALFATRATAGTPQAAGGGESPKTKRAGRDARRSLYKPATVASAISFRQTFAELRRSRPALAVTLLCAMLPILGYAGLWDSYFSFSLYSESQASANIFVTQAFADRLPPGLRAHVQPFSKDYDPAHQGPLVFMFGPWCYEECHVPPIPEPRAFAAIYRFLRPYSRDPGDLRMLVGPRAGPVLFYEGDDISTLAARR